MPTSKTVTPIVQMQQVTLTPSLLFTTAPDAPSGRVHVSAIRTVRESDGTSYTREGETPDVLIGDKDVCDLARQLYELIAAKLAASADSAVRHRTDADPISAPTR